MTRYARYRRTFNPSMKEEQLAASQNGPDSMAGSAYKKVCLKCRKPGHRVANCPLGVENVNICYNCGSTEHSLGGCSEPFSNFAFAICYVCKEKGHLAGQCPKNERGVYPDGGSCRFCGSTKHLAKNCNPTSKDPKNVLVASLPLDQSKQTNPEHDYAYEALQTIEADKQAKKMAHSLKKKPKQSKVVKF